MIRMGTIAALLAAFAIPAFAEDAMVKPESQPVTTNSAVDTTVSKDDATVGSAIIKDGGHDCMKRRSATLNMM
ncbi:hypothetical protein JJB09_23640 [Rhizobium sp. KVB221]|uniref:Uncharacterized protein n=1 Tax=Rhizobium setariae TaxID=2801340 RepID=A0A936YWF8_9HYPH|nr:hypothetical protein [Rhizobium setariae]MBL0375012.1 hypothetical protein [Rhizobium setariae]